MANPVPVTLLAGFLGSGKTTLANRILSEDHKQRFAVIVNEFGDVNIDGRLVVGTDDNVIELSNGCLCCTVQGDLAATLHTLLRRRRQAVDAEPFERILIEASGLASPGPVVQTLLVDPMLALQLRLDAVITLVHGEHIAQQLEEHPEASDQIGYADQIILNHCDQCTPEMLTAAAVAIRTCNSYADVVQTTRADVDIASLLNIRTWERIERKPVRSAPQPAHAPHDHHDHDDEHAHTCDVSTLTLRSTEPLDVNRLRVWLVFLVKRSSHDLMRLKGIMRSHQHDAAITAQGVYRFVELREGPGEAPEESVLVLIGRHLDADEIQREWEDCRART
jgi:G3E family GTPase